MPENKPTYQDILDAVFYAHEKPEVLAKILADLLGVEHPD